MSNDFLFQLIEHAVAYNVDLGAIVGGVLSFFGTIITALVAVAGKLSLDTLRKLADSIDSLSTSMLVVMEQRKSDREDIDTNSQLIRDLEKRKADKDDLDDYDERLRELEIRKAKRTS